MRRFLVAVLLGLVLYCLSASDVPAQQHDPQLQERFIQGVKHSWEKLQEVSFRARCVITQQGSTSDKAKAKPNTSEYEIGIRGPNGLQTGVRRGVAFVQARNAAYAFLLHRSRAGNSLQSLERVHASPSIDAKIADAEAEARAMALAPYYLWEEPLARAIARESFEIKRVYAVRLEGRDFVRVEFNYGIDEPSRKIHDRYTDAYLICDPARQWVTREYGGTFLNLNNKGTGTMATVLDLGDDLAEMPLATRTTHRFSRPEIGFTGTSVIGLEVLAKDLPEEELYLTHYGLPEPNFGSGWFGTWIWYLVAGISLIVVGAIAVKRRAASRRIALP